jgi:hypothetical protein
MRPGGGGIKGGAFERKICVALSQAMTNDERKDLFWRTSMSGGRATIMNRVPGQRNISQTGDISAIDPLGNWLTDQMLIECKHHRDVQFNHYLLNRGGKIADWIKTAKQQAGSKRYALIFKQNNMPTLVFTDAPFLDGPANSNATYRMPLPLLIISQGYPTSTRDTHTLHKFDHFLEAIRAIFPPIKIERRRPSQ